MQQPTSNIQDSTLNIQRTHAIVIGGSIAGLLAARVLADERRRKTDKHKPTLSKLLEDGKEL